MRGFIVFLLFFSIPAVCFGRADAFSRDTLSRREVRRDTARVRRDSVPPSDLRVYLNDSISAAQAEKSLQFYESLHQKSRQSNFWRATYGLFLKTPKRAPVSTGEVVDETSLYAEFRGKKIAAINIETNPVFERARSVVQKGAQAIHVVTRKPAIKRDLLFEVGDTFNAELIVKNKQLLRSRRYIADVEITVVPVDGDPGAVIINVWTRDSWSIGIDGTAAGLNGNVTGDIFDQNFIGSGNNLRYKLSLNWRTGSYEGSRIQYDIPNILGTFSEGHFIAGRSFANKEFRASINKNFILPSDNELGFTVSDQTSAVGVRYSDPRGHSFPRVDTVVNMHAQNIDVWFGESWYFSKQNTSMYLIGRFDHLNFADRPEVALDFNPYFHNKTTILGSFGFYRERFLTTNLIYGYGYDEYIATGYKAEITGGYMKGEFRSGLYGGFSLKRGQFANSGYWKGELNAGGYYDTDEGRIFRSSVDFKIDYFTNLLGHGRNRYRQFVSMNYMIGLNRGSGYQEEIFLTRESGPRLLRDVVMGTNRMVLNTETVVFTQWQPMSFRLALFAFADIGSMGYNANPFKNNFYSTIGFGIRMKNEMLVFSAIQLSFYVAFGSNGLLKNEWVRMSSERRMGPIRYMPGRPVPVVYW